MLFTNYNIGLNEASLIISNSIFYFQKKKKIICKKEVNESTIVYIAELELQFCVVAVATIP
jgi:hypothetical protein